MMTLVNETDKHAMKRGLEIKTKPLQVKTHPNQRVFGISNCSQGTEVKYNYKFGIVYIEYMIFKSLMFYFRTGIRKL